MLALFTSCDSPVVIHIILSLTPDIHHSQAYLAILSSTISLRADLQCTVVGIATGVLAHISQPVMYNAWLYTLA